MFTQKQIQTLINTISKYHLTFIGFNIGEEFFSSEDRLLLETFGVDLSMFTGKKTKVEEAFIFGILSQVLSEKKAKDLKYKELKGYIESGQFIPLSKYERATLDSLKTQSFSDIRGLEGRIKSDLNNILINNAKSNRETWEKIIREEALSTFEKNRSVKSLSTAISDRTLNWGRDFDRISDYILHTAFDEGRAAGAEREYGKDAEVYKTVYPGACKHCIKAYLTNGIDSEPIVFKLSVLRANGTNIGRKSTELLPVVGPLHPYCRCPIHIKKPDYIWDSEKKGFRLDPNFKRKVERKSKVSIQVGDENFVI